MDRLSDVLLSGKRVVVITGAGISTLSGIPDFRGKNGLYTKGNNVEYMLSIDCFRETPDEFYNYYVDNMIMKGMEPNIVHKTLADLEQRGCISGVITQNIDNLHQKAGSKNVIDIHGNGEEFYCTKCKTSHTMDEYTESRVCKVCGSVVRPDIVLYGEMLDSEKVNKALYEIYNADALLVLGTSLVVSTAGSLVQEFIRSKGEQFDCSNLIIVNNQETPFDNYADKRNEDLGMVFTKVRKETVKE